MTSERTQAYGRIVKTLEDLGPAKLLAAEQERIRDAADTLIFAEGPDEHVLAALEDVRTLADHLVESGRSTEERALMLLDDHAPAGPLADLAYNPRQGAWLLSGGLGAARADQLVVLLGQEGRIGD